MNRNEIVQNLTKVDRATIAREIGVSLDLVHKTIQGARNNQKVWDAAEALAYANIRKLKSLTKAVKAEE